MSNDNASSPQADPRLTELGEWLAREAQLHQGPERLEALFRRFCAELVRRRLPVWRAGLSLEYLHPEVSGTQLVWMDGSELAVRETQRAYATASPAYKHSPVRIVDETNQSFRRRLEGSPTGMPLLDELQQQSATDYIIFPLPFLTTVRTAALSFATRHPGGFDCRDLQSLESASQLLSPYAERQVLHRIAIDLLDTYVGPRTGQRIIEGRVDRGDVERIEAAIWLADLRGFTRFSEEAPIEQVIEVLNAWLEPMVAAIEAEGGEVLKFIGDAALAIFPTSAERPQRAACAQALDAAERFCRSVDALNRERRQAGAEPLRFGLALHYGELAYGNVGAPRRLDFTVIGPSVNLASRLQELTKHLGESVLISEALAAGAERPLRDLGMQSLRDVARPQRVFAPAERGSDDIALP